MIIPHQIVRWLSDRFDALFELRQSRWWRALLGGMVGLALGTVVVLWEMGFECYRTILTALGSGVVGVFAGWGLTYVDDRANLEEQAAAEGTPASAVKTMLLYAPYCLIGLIVVFAACMLLVAVVMRKQGV